MTIYKLFFVGLSFLVVTMLTSSQANLHVFGAPNAAPSNADCGVELIWDGPSYHFMQTCCWTETDPGDPEGIELYYCQMCDYNPETKTASGCGEKYPQGPAVPPSGPVAPQQEGVLEQPPTTDNPPIKSGDSVFSNDDDKVLDEQQPTFSVRNDANVPLNEGGLEQEEETADDGNNENIPQNSVAQR